MSGALLIAMRADCRDRLRQLAEIYRGLGLAVDLVCESGGAQSVDPGLVPRRFASFADPGALNRLLPQLCRDAMPDVMHFSAAVPPVRLSEVPRPGTVISEAGSLPDENATRPDLGLASTEAGRVRMISGGLSAMRLPPRLVRAARLRPNASGLFGWWGTWTGELEAGWRDLTEKMNELHCLPAGAILLAGPGAERVRLPAAPVPVIRRPAADASCLRALDIAVLPETGGARVAEAYAALASGTPVLSLADWTRQFEDRWHLPAGRDAGHLAGLLAEHMPVWEPAAAGQRLAGGLASTLQAFRRDQQVMEAYIAREIAARLGLT
ncbi:MAG: hypothetical protein AAFR17_18410 [Pseudomonadota bacterium]